jgi:hypothetical protein
MFFTGGGNWLAENGSYIDFSVHSIDDDIEGLFHIGNASVVANDTNIAKDLTLGVWGTPTEWWPGLIVKVSQSDIDTLNDTAYAAAERVAGNYLNGTMVANYESVTDTSGIEHQCVVFDYVQDPSGFGEPQRTHLAYSLNTGILIEANTSYSFGVPYELAFRFSGVQNLTTDLTAPDGGFITYLGIAGGIIVAFVVILTVIFRRMSRL